MIRHFTAVVALAAMLSPLTVQAAEKTVVLDVENATCALCAPIVKRSLTQVPGVQAVRVTEANDKSPTIATVTYDDAVTDISKLVTATTNAGYPSTPRS